MDYCSTDCESHWRQRLYTLTSFTPLFTLALGEPDGVGFANMVSDVLRNEVAPLLDPASRIALALSCKRAYRVLQSECRAVRGQTWLLLLFVEHGHNAQLNWVVDFLGITDRSRLGDDLFHATSIGYNIHESWHIRDVIIGQGYVIALFILHRRFNAFDFLTDVLDARTAYSDCCSFLYPKWNVANVFALYNRFATPANARLCVDYMVTALDVSKDALLIAAFETLWQTAGRPINEWCTAIKTALEFNNTGLLDYLLHHVPPDFQRADLFRACDYLPNNDDLNLVPATVAVMHASGYYETFIRAVMATEPLLFNNDIFDTEDSLRAVFLTVPLAHLDKVVVHFMQQRGKGLTLRPLARLVGNGTWPVEDEAMLRALDSDMLNEALDERARAKRPRHV